MTTTSVPLSASRRSFLRALAVSPLAGATLTACGSSGPGGQGQDEAGAAVWYLSGQPSEQNRQDNIDTWNSEHPDQSIAVTFFQNDAYKAKIKTAVGAGQAPTLIYSWGGGTLASYAAAGQVLDLTPWLASNPKVKASVLESTYEAGSVGGKVYGMPVDGAAPVVLYYNKELFGQVGAQPPTTWADALSLVEVFKREGIAAFALAGQSNWTSMMWLEYLFDRIGGSSVFDAIYAGEPDAWSNPDALKALAEAQDLISRGGFINGFESVAADSNADQALLMTGKAAMLLQGAWCYGIMKGTDPAFVSEKLGWTTFPTVEGGKGDPSAIAGNPANYLSIFAKASEDQQEVAKAYLADGANSSAYVRTLIDGGGTSVATEGESLIGQGPDAPWQRFNYGLVGDAANFVQSWDQALSPTAAQELLTNISSLFTLSITPEQFAQNMNATLLA